MSRRAHRLRLLGATGCSILIAGLGLFLLLRASLTSSTDLAGIAAFIVVCISLAIIWLWRFQRWAADTSLTLSPTMLDYQTPGLRIRTEWSNVLAVIDSIDPHLGYLPTPHLLLERPAGVSISILARVKHLRSHGWHVDRQIPLDIFGWERSSELRLVIRRLAPQLFATHGTQSAVHMPRH